jgi:voltage-gated potassium channel
MIATVAARRVIRHHPAGARKRHPRRGEHPAMGRQRLPDDLTARRAGLLIGGVTLVVAIGAGLLMRSVDEHDFPTAGSGLWWAVQTVTTVGYGDKVPTSTEGRLVATVVMVTALGFMSVMTASISALFVESARRRRSRRDDATLEHIADRLDAIERRLEELSAPRP